MKKGKAVNIVYYHDAGFILYERGELSLECILRSYDDIIKIISFNSGLLTVLMKKGRDEIEEYVDFESVLYDLFISKEKDKYFKGITEENMVLKRGTLNEKEVGKL